MNNERLINPGPSYYDEIAIRLRVPMAEDKIINEMIIESRRLDQIFSTSEEDDCGYDEEILK